MSFRQSLSRVIQQKVQLRRQSTQTKTASGLASDFFSSLRWKAASVLTASLSEAEKNELFTKLQISAPVAIRDAQNVKNDESTERVMEHSIAEAVAKARTEEAQKQQDKWEKEREQLTLQAQQAAQARIEQEVAIHKQRTKRFDEWTRELSEAKGETTGTNAVTRTQVEESSHHPVLGPVISDFGYKRIHSVPAKALSDIAVWKRQRTYRHDRAKNMAKDKQKSIHLGFPGIIVLHEDPEGNLKVVDGQHRVGMMSLMQEQADASGVDLDNILVEVYPQQPHHDENHAEQLFVEVNKAEPVKLIDMPGVAKVSERNAISAAAEGLLKQFPTMFSASQRCRAPNLNIDNLRDELFAAKIMSRHGIKSGAALEKWMLEQNDLLATKAANQELQGSFSQSQLQKAKASGFYLGLDKTWYYN
ncbi:hypothetical protein MPSEU_000600600 [Mayamaea pseudoterrestris]|nr:hypothetical protein MPSEU_000600600 [Mayamaea pseudoterrestris]